MGFALIGALFVGWLFGTHAPKSPIWREGAQVVVTQDRVDVGDGTVYYIKRQYPRCPLHYTWYETTDGKQGACLQ